jgi:putative alpha-1,2-mannosidase
MMHESGTGGAPKYGVVSQMPVAGHVKNPLVDLGQNRKVNDTAEVGYYKSSLSSNIDIELAATAHAGMYKYAFPSGENSIVVDVSHVLPSFRGLGWGQGYAGGSFQLTDNGYTGSGIYNNGWNIAPDWTIYFCGDFDQAATSKKTFTGHNESLSSYGNNPSTKGSYRQGGVFNFKSKKVTSRVGISFISTDKACSNVQNEIPKGTKMKNVVKQAQSNWNEAIFEKVTTTETNTTVLTQLYSYLYGMNLLPSNRTGENPGWQSDEPYYDDFFTLWDLFRCSTPLWQILQPTAYEEIIRALIDIWRHEGWLPDARSSNFNGKTQGGSNADNVLADAYVKGVRGSVNWQDGYGAVKKDAEVTPPNNNDPIAPDSSTKEGRGALPDWKEFSYIAPNFTRAVSRAVEYAVNDFSVSQIANGLGKGKDGKEYIRRSRNWRNHWNPKQKSLGFSGFMVPKYSTDAGFANSSFEYPYDPLQCGKLAVAEEPCPCLCQTLTGSILRHLGDCYWNSPFYEDVSHAMDGHTLVEGY